MLHADSARDYCGFLYMIDFYTWTTAVNLLILDRSNENGRQGAGFFVMRLQKTHCTRSDHETRESRYHRISTLPSRRIRKACLAIGQWQRDRDQLKVSDKRVQQE